MGMVAGNWLPRRRLFPAGVQVSTACSDSSDDDNDQQND